MKKLISILAALTTALCLVSTPMAAETALDAVPGSFGVPVYGTSQITKEYFDIVLGTDQSGVTLPGGAVFSGVSTDSRDAGLQVVIVPVTPDREPEGYAWAAPTARTLGEDAVIYYLLFYRDGAPTLPQGRVHITCTAPDGFQLYYMDGTAQTARLPYDPAPGGADFTMEKDGYYIFVRATYVPTGDDFDPTLWTALLLSASAGLCLLAAYARRRKVQ